MKVCFKACPKCGSIQSYTTKYRLDGNFHLDHKFSIVEGFNQNIDPSIIGDIKNLKFIPWEENVKKRTKCSITINELIKK